MEFGSIQARCCARTPIPCSPPRQRCQRGEGKLRGHGGSSKIRPSEQEPTRAVVLPLTRHALVERVGDPGKI